MPWAKRAAARPGPMMPKRISSLDCGVATAQDYRAQPSRRLVFWFRLAESDLVAERVEKVELIGSPEGLRDAGTPVGIILGAELGVQFPHALEGDLEAGAGRAIAI